MKEVRWKDLIGMEGVIGGVLEMFIGPHIIAEILMVTAEDSSEGPCGWLQVKCLAKQEGLTDWRIHEPVVLRIGGKGALSASMVEDEEGTIKFILPGQGSFKIHKVGSRRADELRWEVERAETQVVC